MFVLRSSAFAPNAPIPAQYTCDGADRSPPLDWTDPPAGTQSFALIVDDPDAPAPAAPKRIWVHWLRYNLSPDVRNLAEGAGNDPPESAAEAVTDDGTHGYHGPCPPIGRHRYFFRLFALDHMVPDLGAQARRRDLERAMEGHVRGTAVLMGTYARPGRA